MAALIIYWYHSDITSIKKLCTFASIASSDYDTIISSLCIHFSSECWLTSLLLPFRTSWELLWLLELCRTWRHCICQQHPKSAQNQGKKEFPQTRINKKLSQGKKKKKLMHYCPCIQCCKWKLLMDNILHVWLKFVHVEVNLNCSWMW